VRDRDVSVNDHTAMPELAPSIPSSGTEVGAFAEIISAIYAILQYYLDGNFNMISLDFVRLELFALSSHAHVRTFPVD